MRRNARFALLSLLVSGLLFTQSVEAQEPAGAGICPNLAEGAVDVTLSIPSTRVSAGALLPVSVSLENKTGKPLSGGVVLVKLVSRSLIDERLSGAEGAAVARTVALDKLSLPAEGAIEREFLLSVSDRLPEGRYDLQVAYALSEDFNLYNPDIDLSSGNGLNTAVQSVSIINERSETFAYIDADSVVAADAGEEAAPLVSVSLVNPGSSSAEVPVLWKAYSWNALSEKGLVESRVELVRVPAGGERAISYEIQDASRSMYQVVVQADSNGMRSYATAVVSGSKGESIIQLAGIAPFPSRDGDVQAYACVHNVYSDDETPRSVRLSVTSPSGRVLGEGEFPVPSGVHDFEVSKQVSVRGGDVVLLASVVSNGFVEQSISRIFRCGDFGGCAAEVPPGGDAAIFALTLLAAGTGGLITMRYYLKHVRARRTVPPAEPPFAPPLN